MLALLPPVLALVIQWPLWFWLTPMALILFYPAVFFSSWIGGLRGGLAGTALSVGLVGYFFLPSQLAFGFKLSHLLLSLGVFSATGVFFAVLHEKLRAANARLAQRVERNAVELQTSRESVQQSEARMEAIVASAMDAIISVDSAQQVLLFNAAAEEMFGCSAASAIGRPLDQFIPPRSVAAEPAPGAVSSWLEDIPARAGVALGGLRGLRSSGAEFPVEASISHVEVAGQKTHTIIIRDVTQRSQDEEALRMRHAHAQSLLRLARRLEPARTKAEILECLREELQAMLGLQHVWFYLLTEDRRHLRLVMACIEEAPGGATGVREEELLIEGDAMLEEITTSHHLVVVEDARTDPRTNKEIVRRNGNRTLLNMPVSLYGHSLGAIGSGTFGDEGTRSFSEVERDYFAALANQAAAALDRVQAFEKQQSAEAGERRSLARYRDTLDNMLEGCQIISPEMRYLYVNATAARHGRQSADELLGRTMQECYPGIEHTPTYDSIRRCLEHKQATETENLFVYPDGSHAFFQLCIQPVPEGVFILSLDISERKRLEERALQLNVELEGRVAERTVALEALNAELRSSRREMQSLFESLPGLYLVLTPALKIVAASDAYLKATHTTREGILGRGLFEVFPDNPEDAHSNGMSNLGASLTRVLQNRVPDIMAIQKYDVRGPDGVFEERYWSPMNSPLLDDSGEVRYIIHRVEEVTDFVRHKLQPAEAPDAAQDARLQRMEAEIFYSSQQVQAANKLLESANKELESFSYSVSHDLRAPLRAMDGFSRAVLEDHGATLPEEGRRQLQVIRTNAQKMGELIDDLLTFSRLSRLPLKKQTIDTRGLVQATLEELAGSTGSLETPQREVRLHSLPECVGDPALLKQVWLNLIGNAIKYSRKRDKAVVEIGCDQEGSEDTFYVRDNGAGFDMRYAHKLFGVFQRLHRAEDYEGTGVGLAIVQRVIHRHGGRVWAESAPDQGTTFYFTLAQEPATSL